MTDAEMARYVLAGWLREVPASSLMVNLICLGRPVKRVDILAVIRAYVDSESENRSPRV
jgi:hypothetical protein